MSGDVGDVDPQAQPIAVRLRRDRIVEVARRRRVDGEGGERRQVAPLRPASRVRGDGGSASSSSGSAKPRSRPRLPDHRPDDVGSPLRRAERPRSRGCRVGPKSTSAISPTAHVAARPARPAGPRSKSGSTTRNVPRFATTPTNRSGAFRSAAISPPAASSALRARPRVPSSARVGGPVAARSRRAGSPLSASDSPSEVTYSPIVRSSAPPAARSDHLLDGALAVRAGADERRQAVVLERGREDLGGGSGVAVDQDHRRLAVERLARRRRSPWSPSDAAARWRPRRRPRRRGSPRARPRSAVRRRCRAGRAPGPRRPRGRGARSSPRSSPWAPSLKVAKLDVRDLAWPVGASIG